MKYEIIKNSESFSGYDIPDDEWVGEIHGLVNGWSFEVKNAKGEYDYLSVSWEHGLPEDYANMFVTENGESWLFEIPRWNGWEPTGRVVFRGYAKEYYDADEHEWFVERVDPRKAV